MELYTLIILTMILIVFYYICLNYYENIYDLFTIDGINLNTNNNILDESNNEEKEEEEENNSENKNDIDEEIVEEKEETPEDYYAPIILNKVPMFKSKGEWNNYL